MASPGVEEEAGGGQGEAGGGRGLSGARHASPLFVLLAEEEDDKGEEVGWAGQMGWPAGPVLVGCTVRPGKLCSFYFFLFCLFYLISFATVFNSKIISYSAKTF